MAMSLSLRILVRITFMTLRVTAMMITLLLFSKTIKLLNHLMESI